MYPITAIHIPEYITVTSPDTHIRFIVVVSTANSTFSLSRRYSEFEALNNLIHAPFSFPPKSYSSFLSIFGMETTSDVEAKLVTRQTELERFLNQILHSQNPVKYTAPFYDFLCIDQSIREYPGSDKKEDNAKKQQLITQPYFQPTKFQYSKFNHYYSPEKWIEEFRLLQNFLQKLKSEVTQKDRFHAKNDLQQSQNKVILIKKMGVEFSERVGVLESCLKEFERNASSNGGANGGLSKAEILRRSDLVLNLKNEWDSVFKNSLSYQKKPSNDTTDRTALFSSSSSKQSSSKSGLGNSATFPYSKAANSANTPTRTPRKFGSSQVPVETPETITKDNSQLVTLQQTMLNQQESEVADLLQIINRQREIGFQIGKELDTQNELLEDLDTRVERTGEYLKSAGKRLDQVRK